MESRTEESVSGSDLISDDGDGSTSGGDDVSGTDSCSQLASSGESSVLNTPSGMGGDNRPATRRSDGRAAAVVETDVEGGGDQADATVPAGCETRTSPAVAGDVAGTVSRIAEPCGAGRTRGPITVPDLAGCSGGSVVACEATGVRGGSTGSARQSGCVDEGAEESGPAEGGENGSVVERQEGMGNCGRSGLDSPMRIPDTKFCLPPSRSPALRHVQVARGKKGGAPDPPEGLVAQGPIDEEVLMELEKCFGEMAPQGQCSDVGEGSADAEVPNGSCLGDLRPARTVVAEVSVNPGTCTPGVDLGDIVGVDVDQSRVENTLGGGLLSEGGVSGSEGIPPDGRNCEDVPGAEVDQGTCAAVGKVWITPKERNLSGPEAVAVDMKIELAGAVSEGRLPSGVDGGKLEVAVERAVCELDFPWKGTVQPVNVRQLRDFMEEPGDGIYVLYGRRVAYITMVGRIVSVGEEQEHFVNLVVDDYWTGQIGVTYALDRNMRTGTGTLEDLGPETARMTGEQRETMQRFKWVRVSGVLERQGKGRMGMSAKAVVAVTDMNEWTYHMLEVFRAHLSLTQPRPGNLGSNPSAGTGGEGAG